MPKSWVCRSMSTSPSYSPPSGPTSGPWASGHRELSRLFPVGQSVASPSTARPGVGRSREPGPPPHRRTRHLPGHARGDRRGPAAGSTSRTTLSGATRPAGASPNCWPPGPAKGSPSECCMTGSARWARHPASGVFSGRPVSRSRPFHRPQLVDVVTNISRNHRKLVLADGSRADPRWVLHRLRMDRREYAGGQPWRDTAVDIHGPAAAVLDQTFVNSWEITGVRCHPIRLPESWRRRGMPRFGSSAGTRPGARLPGDRAPCRRQSGTTLDHRRLSRWRHPGFFRPCATRGGMASMSACWFPARATYHWSEISPASVTGTPRSGVRIYEWDGPMLQRRRSSARIVGSGSGRATSIRPACWETTSSTS